VSSAVDRRSFLKSTAGTLTLLLSREGLGSARMTPPLAVPGPPLRLGIVGLGPRGREILDAIGRTEAVQAAAICDVYEPLLTRARASAPKAASTGEWRRLLDSTDVEAIVIATPTPAHREIAVAALQAGKHVYCEAPLAASPEDARAIAAAAGSAKGLVFQGGLQGRSNALYRHVRQFVKSGVLGDVAAVHAQWNRRDSWRRAAPAPERERALNWRLDAASPGLMGEIGIHPIDLVSQYLEATPVVVGGSGTIAAWRDGRNTPDTAACVLRFGRHRAEVRATLASSFGGADVVFQGSNSSLLLKENRAWLIKEADSPLLGWEVYARKESVHDETGIALVADATKLLQAGKEPGKDGPVEPETPALVLALEAFAAAIRTGAPCPCGPVESCAATEAALAANAAVLSEFEREMAHDR